LTATGTAYSPSGMPNRCGYTPPGIMPSIPFGVDAARLSMIMSALSRGNPPAPESSMS
jgi:hypothetical protein